MSDTCPQCSEELRTGEINGRRSILCYACGYVKDPDMRRTKLKLPHFDPGRQEIVDDQNEAEIVRCLEAELKSAGYIVWHIGQGNAKIGGNSTGFPDIVYTRLEWSGALFGIECKTRTGRERAMQEHFRQQGITQKARSVGEGMAIAEATRARLEGLVRG